MNAILTPLRPTVIFLGIYTALFGFAYPCISTIALQTLFPKQAEGSLIIRDGKVLGSELIGQNFSEPRYFWGRLSATAPYAYNAGASTGSNLGAANPVLLDAVKSRVDALGSGKNIPVAKSIPVDLATASGSGLDPHISVAAAEYQIRRVAVARNLTESKVKQLVTQYTESRQLGFLGEAGVNVLKLNLALDGKL